MTESPGPYEAYPSGGESTAPPARPQPPSSINIAFCAFLLSTVISLVSALLLLGSKDEVADQLRRNNTARLTEDQISTTAQITVTAFVVIAIVIALIYLWLAFKLRAGRNWARITLTVFTVLQVISLTAGHGTIVGYLSVLAAAVGLVFSYIGGSNEYINTVKGSRA
ncbi:hypothetical protein SAMN05421835_101472 [Amycolatopsis sacchari]|uniref:Uncharacterized protein n=1 Tax=Amycolatopsis sacchari TaxID=115433 RepID=A0A1I3KAJ3_9PSEU|nr:hypothetical protein [Amycolatopsis sacchari]SFI69318.1 hypothetical protein SAMN05421835_101472 [Amycolatopsis sacchari]